MPRLVERLHHIRQAIADIRTLLDGAASRELEADRIRRAALERFFEIISEASRHIPNEIKESYPDIPWRRVAGIGNHLRHAYEQVDLLILWNAANRDLAALDSVVEEIAGKLSELE